MPRRNNLINLINLIYLTSIYFFKSFYLIHFPSTEKKKTDLIRYPRVSLQAQKILFLHSAHHLHNENTFHSRSNMANHGRNIKNPASLGRAAKTLLYPIASYFLCLSSLAFAHHDIPRLSDNLARAAEGLEPALRNGEKK